MKIGIAEDVALLRDGIAALLTQHGHTVLWVASDASELHARMDAAAASETPDLLIVDVRMPPGNSDDGLRAAVEIRARRPDIAIMILSQHLGNEYAKELLATASDSAGGTGYLLKERIGRVSDFLAALDALGEGGIAIDPKVIAHLLHAQSASGPLRALSAREQEVLALMAEGYTNEQITARLHLSPASVERHISSIFMKLDIGEGSGNKRVLAVLEYLRA